METLKKVSDTVTDKPVYVAVDVRPQYWWHRFIKPRKKVFAVANITLGNLIRISKIMTGVDLSAFDKMEGAVLEKNYRVITDHLEDIIEVVAIGLHNKRSEPPQSLINLIRDNFNAKELFAVMVIVIKQMDVLIFMSTIISAKRINILESQTASVKSVSESGVSL